MLAKIIAGGADRDAALRRLATALHETRIAGPSTNLAFLSAIVASSAFQTGGVDTGFIDREGAGLVGEPIDHSFAAHAVEEWLSHAAAKSAALATGAWARTDSFELAGIGRRSSLDVAIEGEPATIGVEWSADGPRVASADADAATEIVWGEGEAFVLSGGRQLRVAFPDPLARELDAGVSGGEILTPMHGRVVTVAVSVGDHVDRGDPLFSLEAMKMEHGVSAPIEGTVTSVRIVEGQQMEEGVVAVVIEPSPGTESCS